jgi:peptidoglycan-associated lipoprotein
MRFIPLQALRFMVILTLATRLVACASSEPSTEEALTPATTEEGVAADAPAEAPLSDVDPVAQEVVNDASSPDFTDPSQVALGESSDVESASTEPASDSPTTLVNQDITPIDATLTDSSEPSAPELASDTSTSSVKVLFGKSSSRVGQEFRGQLLEIAAQLKADRNLKISVEGHSDARGRDDFNRKLALKRANAVKKYLQRLGVRSSQMKAISHGKDKLIAFGDTESDHAQNRRVEVIMQ